MTICRQNATFGTHNVGAEFLRTFSGGRALRFCRALLGPLDTLDLDNINWLIAGGSSGRSAAYTST